MNIGKSSLARHFAFCILHFALAAAASSAMAAPTIAIDKVAQRWPWNNKVDITYTIADGTDLRTASLAGEGYLKIVFTVTIGSETYTIDGSRDVLARADTGTHTVTWTNAPAGVKMQNCEMYATLHDIEAYYMIIDLATGDYAYDTLQQSDTQQSDTATAWPSAAASRFNTKLFKTDLMVLRRVPRTSKAASTYSNGYPTGDDTNFGSGSSATYKNSATKWTTDRDFFIGIFPVTEAQYYKIMGTSASTKTMPRIGGLVSWSALRNSKTPDTALSDSASSSSLLERLNALIGVSTGFDLPTEVMAEIARRGGTTTAYIWGNSFSVYQLNPRYKSEVQDVASSNNGHPWGLYTTTGNGFDWCLDCAGRPDMKDAPDPWTPYSAGSGHMCQFGPRWSAGAESDAGTKLSQRYVGNNECGCRVTYVAR